MPPHKKVLSVAFCALLCICSGCGTIASRCGSRPFGTPPYQALQLDYEMGEGLCHESRDMRVGLVNDGKPRISATEYVLRCCGIVVLGAGNSVLDIVLDTVFLPLDLAFWLFGVKKSGIRIGATGDEGSYEQRIAFPSGGTRRSGQPGHCLVGTF